MWHAGLEEASKQYFGDGNIAAMLATLLPLHAMLQKPGPVTLKETAFVQVGGLHGTRVWMEVGGLHCTIVRGLLIRRR